MINFIKYRTERVFEILSNNNVVFEERLKLLSEETYSDINKRLFIDYCSSELKHYYKDKPLIETFSNIFELLEQHEGHLCLSECENAIMFFCYDEDADAFSCTIKTNKDCDYISNCPQFSDLDVNDEDYYEVA